MGSEDVCSWPKEDDGEVFLEETQFLSENTKEVLKVLLAQTFRDIEDKYVDQQERVYKERFMKKLSKMIRAFEGYIAQLRALADKADKLHRDCTISNLVAGSTSIVSGVLTIAGLGLAPFTGGLSLSLSAAGIGLGTASAVAEVTTGIVEYASMKGIEANANELSSMKANTEESLKEVVRDIGPKLVPLGENVAKGIKGFKNNIRGIQLIKANPRLEARAMRFLNSGRISARKATQVKKAFGGTALVMSKGARMAGMAVSGLFLVKDIYDVVKQSTHLQEGARTESADQLREQASEMEKIMEDLKEIYVIFLED